MFKIWNIICAENAIPFFQELIENLKLSLIKKNILIQRLNNFQLIQENSINLVLGIHALPIPPKIKNTLFIGFQTEQLPQLNYSINSLVERNYSIISTLLPHYNLIYDIYEGNIDFLKTKNIFGIKKFNVGFIIEEKFKNDIQIYDLCFLGYLSERRKKLLDKLKKQFNIHPINFAFGSERIKIIKQSKICLNIHVEENDFFESLRVNYLISNNCFVLSENSKYHIPFQNNRHLIFCNYHDFEEKIKFYLKHPSIRNKIIREGYLELKKHSMDEVIHQLFIDLKV